MTEQKPPKIIYLQWYGYNEDGPTWCDERFSDEDVAYILFDDMQSPEGLCAHGFDDWDECPVCGH